MAELKEAADRFAKDLMAQNIAGLMLAFTPAGMMKAMAMQGQMAAAGPQPPPTGYEVTVDGEDSALVVLKNSNGEAKISTKWMLDPATSTWKVDDIQVQAEPQG
ncbi:MAG: hypothetical protein R3B97_11960 [Dehalococcoidia bacterium]|nr:hypothetical protein [Dehalococcoidia bacterium]MCB9484664.1 hypothetical protein [Thermoflexaceae bacterium]